MLNIARKHWESWRN